ncbi:MAG: hypothetical protein ACREXW_09540 [Gammaproteobacteria bacterium]
MLERQSADWVLSHAEVLHEQALRIGRPCDVSRFSRWGEPYQFPPGACAGQGESLYAGLKAEGILVKSVHGAHPLLADCRITVGSPEENQALLAALARRL